MYLMRVVSNKDISLIGTLDMYMYVVIVSAVVERFHTVVTHPLYTN